VVKAEPVKQNTQPDTENDLLVKKMRLEMELAKLALETEQLNHRRSKLTLETKESEVRRLDGQRREDLRELVNLRALVAAQKKEILMLYKSEDESQRLRKECSRLASTLKKREKTLDMVKLLVDEFEPKFEQQTLRLTQLTEEVTLSRECKVCLQEAPLFVLVPCGHTVCGDCRPHLKGACHLCRGDIRQTIKLHL
jgi:DNA-directed RNA polymerase beta subunit